VASGAHRITLPNDASCRIHVKFGYRLGMVLPEAGRKFGRYWDVAYYVKPLGKDQTGGAGA
jgi:phosphinothricin acetyltransferase